MIFKIDPKDIQVELIKLVPKGSDLPKLGNIIGESYVAFTVNVFQTSGAYFGGWPKVKESTQKQKTALGFGNNTLIRTGDLRNLTGYNIIGNSIEIFNSAVSDSGFPYGIVHQDPITSPVPQREIYDTEKVPPAIIEDIVNSLIRFYK